MADVPLERNLLFGVLALKNRLIDAADLISAFHTWSADKTRPLDQLLRDRGALADDDHDLVHTLVLKHLRRNGGDVRMTLSTLADAESRDAIRQLDDGDEEVRKTLSTLALAAGQTLSESLSRPTDRRSRYLLTRLHAEGGLGKVWLARDTELNRDVALKEIQPSQAYHPEAWRRFLREAQVTGQLEHPNIVPVYELARREEDHQPFYTMRFVRGRTMRQAIAEHHEGGVAGKADPLERLRLLQAFVAVCQAIGYAHSRGVVHRDLKPENVVLGGFGEAIVLDWGLAKTFDSPDEGGDTRPEVAVTPEARGEATQDGRQLGTPAYMAPEQAAGRLESMDERTDVYGLGTILFEILTGRPPHKGGHPTEILLRIIQGATPVARSIEPTVPAALSAICARAMAKEREGRYAGASDLADEVQRWLADEPVRAYHEPWVARLSRWSRRHKPWVIGATALLLAGLAGVLLTAKARLEREVILSKTKFLELEVRSARRSADLQGYYALVNRSRERVANPDPGWTWAALEEIARATKLHPDPGADQAVELRTLVARALSAFDIRQGQVLEPGLNPACLAFSPAGDLLALGEFKAQAFSVCSVVLIDWETKGIVRTLRFPPSLPFQLRRKVQDGTRQVAFSPGGRRLAVATRSGRIHCWDLDRPEPSEHILTWQAHDVEVGGLAFGDEATLYSCASEGTLKRWSVPAAGGGGGVREVASYRAGQPVQHLAYDRRGGIACLLDDRVQRLDPETLASRRSTEVAHGDRVAWSPDGRLLAVGARQAITVLLDETGQIVRTIVDPAIAAAHRSAISGLGFHPDGSVLMSSGSSDEDRQVKFWDVASGQLATRYSDGGGAGNSLLQAAFHPKARFLVVTGRDRATVSELAGRPASRMIAHQEVPVQGLAFAPDGRSVATVGRSPASVVTSLWETESGAQTALLRVPVEHPERDEKPGVAFDPTGSRVAVFGAALGIRLWEPGSPGPPRAIDAAEPGWLQFSRDGRRLWGRFVSQNALGAWDLARGRFVAEWTDPAARALRGLDAIYSLSTAEPWVAVGGRDGLTKLLRFEGGDLSGVTSWDHRSGPVRSVAVSPDGTAVASGTQRGGIHIHRIPDGERGARDEAHREGVTALAWSPDGRSLVSGSADRTVRLWRRDREELREVLTLATASGPILDAAFSPDGRRIAYAVEGENVLRLCPINALNHALEAYHLGWSSEASTPR